MGDLLVGSHGPEVGNWQRFLNEHYAVDWEGKALDTDEKYGLRTVHATRSWQRTCMLPPSGALRSADRRAAQAQGFIPFLQAKNFGPELYPQIRAVDIIVIHTMENSEKPTDAAENVAIWFAGKNPRYTPPRASAHYCIDRDSIVQCVRDTDIAWHAPGCNHNGIGLEHAGRARQTSADWADEASVQILERSAALAGQLVRRYALPVAFLSAENLAGRQLRGFTTHAEVTKAFPGKNRTHWDPGPHFPWKWYLSMVQDLICI